MAKRPGLNALPALLARLLQSHGMSSRMLEYRLQQRWPEIVGEQIGRHSWPDSIRHRKLYLVAENSVWLQQLMFLKPTMLAKITAEPDGDGVAEIVLRVGPLPVGPGGASSGPPPETKEPDSSVSTEASAAIDDAVEAAADPDLRTRLRALFTRSAG